MALFIELVTDAFETAFKGLASAKRAGGNRTGGAGKKNVRRPLRGIEVREDTHAIVKVVRTDGREIPLFDSSSPDGLSSDGYANFLLQQVQEARMEKHQVIETFGEAYVFFFGENPRFVDCQAVLLNSNDFNWLAEWEENYERYLRGTKLAEMGARLYLFYNDVILEGYMVGSQKVEQVMQPYQAGIQFRLFVTNYRNLGFVEAPDNTYYPTRDSVMLPDGIELTASGSAESLVNAFRGEALDRAQQDSSNRVGDSLLRTFETGANPFVSGTRVSDLIRKMPPSFAVSERVWSELINNPSVNHTKGLVLRNGMPIRGLITDNVDEYTGGSESQTGFGYDEDRAPSALEGTVRSQLEVEDFFRTAIEALSCYGANINSPAAFDALGIGVNFDDGSGGSGGGSNSGGGNGSDSFGTEPLSIVYGRGTDASPFSPTSSPGYGYPSDFSDGQPGHGVVGYGDLGGGGYGSALGDIGDPGFKDPNDFTYAGVSDSRGAFQRFMEQRNDTTRFGNGMSRNTPYYGAVNTGASPGGSSGASVGIGGSLTVFSFSSVGGTLDPTGNARIDPNAVAERLAQNKFGFSNANPFGVQCVPRSDSNSSEDLFTT